MLVTIDSTVSYARRESGGKGFNLYQLSNAGIEVPPWITVGARNFRRFLECHGLAAKIDDILGSAANDEEAASRIRDIIMSHPYPEDVQDLIVKAYETLGAPVIAVRSSALDEDSAQHSFAGQLSTFLYVRNLQDVLQSVKECWASAYSARGLTYRRENNLVRSSEIQVAVVLQEMIDVEVSGVIFTCNPTSGESDQMVINSVYGIGEGLVSGLLDADMFVIDKKSSALIETNVVLKSRQLVRKQDGSGVVETAVETSKQEQPSLSHGDLSALTAQGLAVEKLYRFPQDIEWAIRDGKIYVLQARPITTHFEESTGKLFIWDNSNIIESYGGITLPLTFTFARFVYHQVYVQFCEILLIPHREIRNMDYFLRNMLGSFYGRIYYNLLNWYKLTSILPGFKYNREFMETMMGTGQGLADEIADRIKPPGFQEKLSSKIRRFITGLKFLYFHFTIQKVVDDFLEYFHKVYSEYRAIDYSKMPADEIYDIYQEVERRLLREWKAPIINDYLCMVHFGVFKKLTGLWLNQLGDTIQNDLLCGEGNLESAEPTRELIRMTAMVSANSELRQLIESTPAEDGMEVLKQSSFREFLARVNNYIDKYGFRCMSEMKLEQKDLYQDPAFLFVCIKNYLRAGQIDLEAYEVRERQIRENAEAKVFSTLGGWKKWVYRWSLKNARKAVKNRENTRFCRTRIYGVVRAMFHGIGRDFTLRGIIDRPEDIFFITLQELAGALEGALTNQNLRELIELRKAEYERYNDMEPAPRFMTRGPVYWRNRHTPPEKVVENDIDLLPNQMKGIGCCPGVVEGQVKVIMSPEDDMELNGEILVTLRTDPGWIPLYPAASALLVERGGLLSHSAIVAREMGLPTVVSVKDLTKRLKTGMKVRMDGKTGLIEILD